MTEPISLSEFRQRRRFKPLKLVPRNLTPAEERAFIEALRQGTKIILEGERPSDSEPPGAA